MSGIKVVGFVRLSLGSRRPSDRREISASSGPADPNDARPRGSATRGRRQPVRWTVVRSWERLVGARASAAVREGDRVHDGRGGRCGVRSSSDRALGGRSCRSGGNVSRPGQTRDPVRRTALAWGVVAPRLWAEASAPLSSPPGAGDPSMSG